MMFWYGDNTSGWGWALMTVGMVAFWGLLITGIVLLVRSPGTVGRPASQPPVPSTPEQVLAQRFARGEIDETEYTGRLAALNEHVRS